MTLGKIIKWVVILTISIFVLNIFFGVCNFSSKMADSAINTTYDEFNAKALLKKYEWFKDASAALDAKVSTLKSYEARFTEIKTNYGVDSTKRFNWVREDREQYNVWQSEYLGIKASYNSLAAEYNSAMSKFNYAFCNAGDLPKGADQILPREYRKYIDQ